MGDPPGKDKNTKNRKRNGKEANANISLENYEDLIENENIRRLTEGPKIVTTIRLTPQLKDELKKAGLDGKLSKMARDYYAWYLDNNGFGTELAEQKLNRLNNLSREIDAERMILRETLVKAHDEKVRSTREEADKIRKREEGAVHIDNLAVVYKEELKSILKRGEKRSMAVRQITERIKARELSELKQTFGVDITADELFKKMGLEDVK